MKGGVPATVCIVPVRHQARGTICRSLRFHLGFITISHKFQIVIPKSIRDLLGLRPGQKVQAIAYEDRIELIPIRRMKEMRGFLRGIDTSVGREPDRA